jgi:hypothetical protein
LEAKKADLVRLRDQMLPEQISVTLYETLAMGRANCFIQ